MMAEKASWCMISLDWQRSLYVQTLGYPEWLRLSSIQQRLFGLLGQRCFMRPARWLLLYLQNLIASAQLGSYGIMLLPSIKD